MMKVSTIAIAGAALVLLAGTALATASQAATIVKDGNFNNPSGNGPSSGYTTYNSGTSFNAWKVGTPSQDPTNGGSVDLIGSYWQSPTAGGGSVDMDGNAPGTLSQDLGTLGPGEYQLVFDLSGNPDGGDPTKSLDVSVGSVVDQSYTYLTGSNSEGNMLYNTETLNFYASGPTTLVFASTDTASSPWGPVIADVSVSAIPEPATWAMMLLGVGLIGGGLRMARRKNEMTLTAA